jgi:hypothetical protein
LSNDNGKISTSPKVLIRILSQPTSQVVVLGTSVQFSVTINNSGPVTYQWYFNNTLIPGANLSSYTISNVSNLDSGNYYVVINNKFVIVTSNLANLEVIDPYTDLYSHLYNQMYDQMYDQIYDQIYDPYYNKLYKQLYDSLIYNFNIVGPSAPIPVPKTNTNIPDELMTESNYDYIYDTTYNSMYPINYDQLFDYMYNNLYNNLRNKLKNLPYSDTSVLNIEYQIVNINRDIYGVEYYNPLHNQLLRALYNQMYTQLFNQLYPQLKKQIYG